MLSEVYRKFLRSCFRGPMLYYNDGHTVYRFPSHSIVYPISEHKTEIPCIIHDSLLRMVEPCLDNSYGSINIPILLQRFGHVEYKTIGGLLNYISASNNKLESICYRDKNNNITRYWAAPGIILYDDFTPLILFSKEFEYSYTCLNRISQYICRIDKRVFNNNDAIAKYLKGNFTSHVMEYDGVNNVKVVFEDLSRFIEKAVVPRTEEDFDSINHFLINNKGLVLQ
jgi:hypothetical protein